MALLQKVKINPIVIFILTLLILPVIIYLLVQQGVGTGGFSVIIFGTIVIAMLITRPRTKK
jgi:hypothetical protein